MRCLAVSCGDSGEEIHVRIREIRRSTGQSCSNLLKTVRSLRGKPHEPFGTRTSSQPTSYDVFGGRHTIVSMYNREQWKTDNLRLYECVWKSFREAIAWINEDKKRGAELFHRFTKSKMELEEVIEMTTTPGEVDYLLEPERTMQVAEFLHSVGAIKQLPESWKDYYCENNYDLDGS